MDRVPVHGRSTTTRLQSLRGPRRSAAGLRACSYPGTGPRRTPRPLARRPGRRGRPETCRTPASPCRGGPPERLPRAGRLAELAPAGVGNRVQVGSVKTGGRAAGSGPGPAGRILGDRPCAAAEGPKHPSCYPRGGRQKCISRAQEREEGCDRPVAQFVCLGRFPRCRLPGVTRIRSRRAKRPRRDVRFSNRGTTPGRPSRGGRSRSAGRSGSGTPWPRRCPGSGRRMPPRRPARCRCPWEPPRGRRCRR